MALKEDVDADTRSQLQLGESGDHDLLAKRTARTESPDSLHGNFAPWERTWCRLEPVEPAADAGSFESTVPDRRISPKILSALASIAVGAIMTAAWLVEAGNDGPKSGSPPDVMTVSATERSETRLGTVFRPPPPLVGTSPPLRAAPDHPTSITPVVGELTSGYGSRWNTLHYGLDIANDIGTPVVSATDGVVLESGPASGFGLWVRVRQDDGTIGVYGHINESLVSAGDRVLAGQPIATVGNRGNSTGPHLHYEVWQSDSAKLDPLAWLASRGVTLR